MIRHFLSKKRKHISRNECIKKLINLLKGEDKNMVNFGQMAIQTLDETKVVHEELVRKAIKRIRKEK